MIDMDVYLALVDESISWKIDPQTGKISNKAGSVRRNWCVFTQIDLGNILKTKDNHGKSLKKLKELGIISYDTVKGSHNPTKFILETNPTKWKWTQQEATGSPLTVQPMPVATQTMAPPQNGNLGGDKTAEERLSEFEE